MASGAAGHAIPPFKERLREALESDSLPVALGLDAPAIRTEISRALAASESAGLTGAMDEWIEATGKQR